MDIYDKPHAAAYCQDLTWFGDKLIDFAESVLTEKNRARLVDLFYQRLMEYNMMDYIWSDFNKDKDNLESYFICEGKSAVGKFINFAVPGRTKPVETLHKLITFGHQIKNSFIQPTGKLITGDKVKEIMNYLDTNYGFSGKVFKDKKAIIGIIPYSHKKFSSECLTCLTTGIEFHFFLYHTIPDPKFNTTPESVFFHELGHALYTRYAGGFDINYEMKEILKLYFPNSLEICSPEQQLEIIADILSMGMMYGSPYEKLDPFKAIRIEDKQVFKELFEEIIKII